MGKILKPGHKGSVGSKFEEMQAVIAALNAAAIGNTRMIAALYEMIREHWSVSPEEFNKRYKAAVESLKNAANPEAKADDDVEKKD